MAAPRCKAAQGLHKILSSKKEWHEAIQKYGLQRHTLGQLCMEGSCSLTNLRSKYIFLIAGVPNREFLRIDDSKRSIPYRPMHLARKEKGQGRLDVHCQSRVFLQRRPFR